ncbi:MAG TPA: thioesterase [Hellea balneolensis]|uniref:Thioesterase n=1 Tax=Hellea balneolensis TaxID=287478 RepID=A0A7C5LU27_9PROT|nr:thioesterase [Hellea balneolensis]
MIETFFGIAEAWEADELGHLNMRYYVERAEQARAAFCGPLGLGGAFKSGALSTLVPKQHHVKYHKELRPGDPMRCQTGIVAFDATTITLEHQIFKAPDILSCTVVETLAHISSRTGAEFNWPKRVRDYANKHISKLSEAAHPRNIDLDYPPFTPTIKQAKKLGLKVIGRGMFAAHEAGADGSIRGHALFGRISDSAQNLSAAWPDILFDPKTGVSGALLEKLAVHRARPKIGDCYVIYSGLRAANTYVRELCHWMMDPISGQCWGSFIGVGCGFDLNTRRLIKTDETALALLRPNIIPGLSV